MKTELSAGDRIRVKGYAASELPCSTGVLTAIEGTGMCRAMVTLDQPHPRLGADWAFALSDLQREG